MAATFVKYNRHNCGVLPPANSLGEIPAMSKPAARRDDEANVKGPAAG
jgi:hypothetical protein